MTRRVPLIDDQTGFWAGVDVVGAARGVIYCLKPSSD